MANQKPNMIRVSEIKEIIRFCYRDCLEDGEHTAHDLKDRVFNILNLRSPVYEDD